MYSQKRRSDMAKARARHILVSTNEACENLKTQIEGGSDFAELAKEHSSCPSGKQGGDLGEFGPGQMVPEFDKVVFNEEVGKVHGPVKTQFGYHLLEITSRT
ncbi:peptidylprolyl isomerase [Candidatus Nitrospira salsa]